LTKPTAFSVLCYQVQTKPDPPNISDFAVNLRSLFSPFIIKRYIFLFGYYWRHSLTVVDKKFVLKLSKSQIYLYCKMKS